MSFLSELEQDPFDGDEFVERLAWRSTSGKYESLDSQLLHESFESGVKDLKAILDAHHKKCERLEMVCREEEKCHWLRVTQLHERAKTGLSSFSELDQRLELVSAKVVYLGDQLEGVNTPRARAVEAHKLMTVFADFLSEKEPEVTSADVIQKLSLIAHELPSGPRFESARNRISVKYDAIERQLIEEFVLAHKSDDRSTMRSIATTLSSFKGYNQCVDAFIESAQSSPQRDVFLEIPLLCAKNERLIAEVFPNPRDVTSKLVLNVFHSRLQPLVVESLSVNSLSDDAFLTSLHDLHQKTHRMTQQLERMCDKAFLIKMTKNIFSRFLNNYIQRETQCLREKCAQTLQRFYEQRGHQKRALNSIQELKRDFQHKIGVQLKGIQEISLLSEEVAITLLQETRVALNRAQALSRPQDLANHVMDIFEIQTQFLCVEHMEYALELSLSTISETKSELHFLEVTRQTNAICHLLEKQFHDSVLPLVHSTPRHSHLLKRKREISDQLEHKLNTGLERCLSLVVTWVRALLQSEQKKTDFKPDTEDVVMATQTQASAKVVRLVVIQVKKIRDCVDGRNVDSILTELGVRVHRAIVDHFQQFQFSIVGAMVAICDVNEYRKCAQEFGVPLLVELFGVLHALFNLLIVAPENLKHAMEEISLERSVVLQFIQLRADYKSLRHHFR